MATSYRLRYNETQGEIVINPAFVNPATDIPNSACAIVIGATLSIHRQLEILRRVQQCIDKIIEESFPSPSASQYIYTHVSIDGGKGQIALVDVAGTQVASETEISIFYGDDFKNIPGSSQLIKDTLFRLSNFIKDDVLSAA